jgi:hypothetical protein
MRRGRHCPCPTVRGHDASTTMAGRPTAIEARRMGGAQRYPSYAAFSSYSATLRNLRETADEAPWTAVKKEAAQSTRPYVGEPDRIAPDRRLSGITSKSDFPSKSVYLRSPGTIAGLSHERGSPTDAALRALFYIPNGTSRPGFHLRSTLPLFPTNLSYVKTNGPVRVQPPKSGLANLLCD